MVALLFDFDGLLIDSETAGLVSWQEVYASHGHAVDLSWWLGEVAAGRGPVMPTARLAALVGRALDWPAIEARRLVRRDELIVARPGALDLLARARTAGLPTAIVSNAPDWWIKAELAHTGLDRHPFDVVITKSPDRRGKPAPDGYLAALRALDVPATEAIAFEDSPVGIAAAKAAGIRCVAVPNDVTRHLSLVDADEILASLAEVAV